MSGVELMILVLGASLVGQTIGYVVTALATGLKGDHPGGRGVRILLYAESLALLCFMIGTRVAS